jgi:hypothetical protein
MGDQQRGQDDLLPRTAEEHGSVSDDDLERAEQPELDEMCHATPRHLDGNCASHLIFGHVA